MNEEKIAYFSTTNDCLKINMGDLRAILGLSTQNLLAQRKVTLIIPNINEGEEESTQTIDVTFTQSTFGQRPWFVCPKCFGKKNVLYMPPPYCEEFRCKDCWHLLYPSEAFHRLHFYEWMYKYGIKQESLENKLSNKYLRTATKQKLFDEYARLSKEVFEEPNSPDQGNINKFWFKNFRNREKT